MTELKAAGLPGNEVGLIEDALRSHMRRRAAQAGRYGQDLASLWAQIADHLAGGKLLRPRLFIDTADGLCRREPIDRELLIELGVAIEMLHYAFLLHDDVIDRDFRRRQGLNLLGAAREAHPAPQSEAASRWGSAAGILAGDLGTAYQLQDDLLSAFGAAEQHGKEPWSDFREAKQTPLIAYARTTDSWPQIAEYFGRSSLSRWTGSSCAHCSAPAGPNVSSRTCWLSVCTPWTSCCPIPHGFRGRSGTFCSGTPKR